MDTLKQNINNRSEYYTLKSLFEEMSDICAASDKPIVLMIDEVDSATNNQVFLDFLSQLRAYYIRQATQSMFQSVILAGVYDVKNLKRKLCLEDEHKLNSPWNIASDFKIDMSFSKDEIAQLLFDYTAGYPFLVSKICKLMDEDVSMKEMFGSKSAAWTSNGFYEVIRMLLSEKNTLFESLIGKLTSYPELNTMLRSLLFTGKSLAYNADELSIDIATMFGFIENKNGMVTIANRIFETRLYNFYLSTAEMQEQDIYKASLRDKSQFLVDGHLNMRLILKKFIIHFNDLYGDRDETFLEDEGRKCRIYEFLYTAPK